MRRESIVWHPCKWDEEIVIVENNMTPTKIFEDYSWCIPPTYLPSVLEIFQAP